MNDIMAVLFTSGHVADVVLAVMLIEAIVLITLFNKNKSGIAPSRVVASLGAGVALVLALRAALTGAGWPWIALALSAAFVAHLADLYWRLTDKR
jgi:hypothetical protein